MSGQHNLLHKLCPWEQEKGLLQHLLRPLIPCFNSKLFNFIMLLWLLKLSLWRDYKTLIHLYYFFFCSFYCSTVHPSILACVCFVVSNLFNKVEQFQKWSIYYTTLIIIYSSACFHPHHSHSPVNLITIPQSNHCLWNETLLQFRSSCPDYNHSANNWIPHNTIIHPR